MILKFIESPLLSSNDEAEAIGKLNEFLAELGKKASQENKVEMEEEIKVWVSFYLLSFIAMLCLSNRPKNKVNALILLGLLQPLHIHMP